MDLQVKVDNLHFYLYLRAMSDYYKHISLQRHIEQKLGLLFVEAPEGGNLCFANENGELRNEFKQVFTVSDLHYYRLARPGDHLPADTESFWKEVENGRKLPGQVLY